MYATRRWIPNERFCNLNRYSGTSPTWPCVRWSATRTLSERECIDIKICELHRQRGRQTRPSIALARMWQACSSGELSCHLSCVRLLAPFSLVWLMMYEYYRTIFVPELDLAQAADCKTLVLWDLIRFYSRRPTTAALIHGLSRMKRLGSSFTLQLRVRIAPP